MKELIKRLLEAGKIDAETAEKMNIEADELDGKLKSARDESIERRNKLKEVQKQVEQFKGQNEAILERLGLDPEDEINLDAIADKAKGKTEADEQLKLKIKRLERELESSNAEKTEVLTKYQNAQKSQALEKALSQHEWIDTDLVRQVLSANVEMSDDGFFIGDVAIDEAVKNFSAEKPHLIKADGNGGSGYQKKKGQKNTDYIP